ncbi:hypothetical protein M378DRAFT_161794 [Amanita muscaria Koide BX008]|uniref:Uncharacterized protein n=1 Tax=Amanita muscaria (strain Koide BX008) TaxID=946122 RepID=A0A0C2XAD9_AMAMK|nr:hypothetical protein M378DRAFT_161794 [Amanita muscaria Koide BX008]
MNRPFYLERGAGKRIEYLSLVPGGLSMLSCGGSSIFIPLCKDELDDTVLCLRCDLPFPLHSIHCSVGTSHEREKRI